MIGNCIGQKLLDYRDEMRIGRESAYEFRNNNALRVHEKGLRDIGISAYKIEQHLVKMNGGI